MNELTEFFEHLPGWLNKLIVVALVVLAAALVLAVARRLIRRAMKRSRMRRAETLYPLLSSAVTCVVVFLAVSQILEQVLGVSAAALLTAAGVLGVAVGFGAQSLVKDIISGFFILLDDQYATGERVTLDGFTGTVEELGLRSTKLRNDSGDVFFIPNGSVGKVVNHSRKPAGQDIGR